MRLVRGRLNFNPRTPVGCDHARRAHNHPSRISIHAPQWGATVKREFDAGGRVISIHAPQWGATPKKRYFYYMTEFQSTHPSGVRLFRLAGVRLGLVHFNPRTPVGCDQHGRCSALHSRKFQSTHPSGVRRGGRGRERDAAGISIHAPQWGATLIRKAGRRNAGNFNPRTPVGCD